MRKAVFPVLLILVLVTAQAQVSAPPSDQTVPRPPAPATAPQSSPPAGVDNLLLRVQQAAGQLRLDLARLRVDKWKTDGRTKQQAQDNAQSLDRNLQLALPGMIQQVQATPAGMAAQFKLYRNLNALYDVLSGLTESAGAFGPKEEYASLQSDAASFDELRRQMGDQAASLALHKDEEINRLAAQARAAAAATPPEPPKKIVIDDAEPAKPAAKPKAKKKAVPKPQPPQPQQGQAPRQPQ